MHGAAPTSLAFTPIPLAFTPTRAFTPTLSLSLALTPCAQVKWQTIFDLTLTLTLTLALALALTLTRWTRAPGGRY